MENQNQKTEPIAVQDKNIAALSYIWVMSVFVYLTKKNNPYIRFHASQALALFILSVVCWFIPLINQGLELILGILMVMGFIKAAQGEYFKIPVIAQIVFSPNPIKSTLEKVVGAGKYVFFWVQSKVSNKQEIRSRLAAAQKELVGDLSQEQPGDPKDVKIHNDIAAFGYLWILSVVILVMNKDSEFVRFHARQGVVLFVASCIFALIPVLGFYLNVVVLLLCITGFIMAFSGERYRIPVVAALVEKNPSLEDFYLNIKSFFLYVRYAFNRSVTSQDKKTYAQVRSEVSDLYQDKKDIYNQEEQESKDIAAASYLFLGPVIWLLHKDKKFVLFHARQATFLLILFIVLFLIVPLRSLAWLTLAMMLLGFLMSTKSEYYHMPFIYDLITSNVTWKDVGIGLVKIVKQTVHVLKRLFIPEKTPAAPSATPGAPTVNK